MWAAALSVGAGSASAQPGADVYASNCAVCHDGGMNRAPTRDLFAAMVPERVLHAMCAATAASPPLRAARDFSPAC